MRSNDHPLLPHNHPKAVPTRKWDPYPLLSVPQATPTRSTPLNWLSEPKNNVWLMHVKLKMKRTKRHQNGMSGCSSYPPDRAYSRLLEIPSNSKIVGSVRVPARQPEFNPVPPFSAQGSVRKVPKRGRKPPLNGKLECKLRSPVTFYPCPNKARRFWGSQLLWLESVSEPSCYGKIFSVMIPLDPNRYWNGTKNAKSKNVKGASRPGRPGHHGIVDALLAFPTMKRIVPDPIGIVLPIVLPIPLGPLIPRTRLIIPLGLLVPHEIGLRRMIRTTSAPPTVLRTTIVPIRTTLLRADTIGIETDPLRHDRLRAGSRLFGIGTQRWALVVRCWTILPKQGRFRMQPACRIGLLGPGRRFCKDHASHASSDKAMHACYGSCT